MVTYLGGKTTEQAQSKQEISARIGAAHATYAKLKLPWKEANASTKWKINVINPAFIKIALWARNIAVH